MASGGCATSADKLTREIPPPPAYARPVAVPEPKAPEDVRVISARERAGRVQANKIILALRAAWEKMRAELGGQ